MILSACLRFSLNITSYAASSAARAAESFPGTGGDEIDPALFGRSDIAINASKATRATPNNESEMTRERMGCSKNKQ
jgi:hypothetical protein